MPPSVPCGGGQTSGPPPGSVIQTPKGTVTVPATSSSPAQIRAFAVAVANQDYADYSANFTVPSTSLMVDVGLWIALEATVAFIVGLGLASLMGQRTVPVILLVVLELIFTPIFSRAHHFATCSTSSGASWAWPCSISSRATCRTRSAWRPGRGRWWPRWAGPLLRPESTLVASLVIVGWIVFWTAIGAWRMMTRDT